MNAHIKVEAKTKNAPHPCLPLRTLLFIKSPSMSYYYVMEKRKKLKKSVIYYYIESESGSDYVLIVNCSEELAVARRNIGT